MYGAAILFPGHPYIESATALSDDVIVSRLHLDISNLRGSVMLLTDYNY